MERDINESFGNANTEPAGSQGAGTSGGSAGTFGSGAERASTSFSGAPSAMGQERTTGTPGASQFEKVKEKATGKLGQAREKASELKSSLADKLEAGADKLRQRAHGGSGTELADATAEGSTALVRDDRLGHVADRVAGGMQSTANWVREADIESIKADVQGQVKNHPARTLLVAVGLGYLLGKAFRR